MQASSRARNHVIILEDYDFRFPVGVIDYIVKLHNQGMTYKEIARKVHRRQLEVILVLLDVADAGKEELAPFVTVGSAEGE